MIVARWPVLTVVVDRDHAGDEERWLAALRAVGEAAIGAPVAVQVRSRSGDLAGLAARAREALPRGALCILNGDAVLAQTLGYDGVHWPEALIPREPADGALRWRSAAVHAEAALDTAARAGADAVVFGPVFSPGSKRAVPAGVGALRSIVGAIALPVIAIGGITPLRARECLDAGARGVAVVSGVLDARSIPEAIEEYLAHISTSCTGGTCRASRSSPDPLGVR